MEAVAYLFWLLRQGPPQAAGGTALAPGLTTTMTLTPGDHGTSSHRSHSRSLTRPRPFTAPPAPATTFPPCRSPARWRARAAEFNERGVLMILWGRTPRSLTSGDTGDGTGGERGMGGNAVARAGWGGLGPGGGGGDRPGIGCATASMVHKKLPGTQILPEN